MAVWAVLVALALSAFAVFNWAPNPSLILSGALELAAVFGLFALICAAEANS
jgi:hypothetical protein